MQCICGRLEFRFIPRGFDRRIEKDAVPLAQQAMRYRGDASSTDGKVCCEQERGDGRSQPDQ